MSILSGCVPPQVDTCVTDLNQFSLSFIDAESQLMKPVDLKATPPIQVTTVFSEGISLLPVFSTQGLLPGMLVSDFTNSLSIAPNTRILTVDTQKSQITLSQIGRAHV